MKIVHVTSTLDVLGGAEQYVLRLARNQSQNGHDVCIVTNAINQTLREELESEGIMIQVVSNWRPYPSGKKGPLLLKAIFHALDLLDCFQPRWAMGVPQNSIIHIHRFQGLGFPISLLSKIGPVIHTAHDHSLIDYSATAVRRGLLTSHLGYINYWRSWILKVQVNRLSAISFPTKRIFNVHLEVFSKIEGPLIKVGEFGWIRKPVDQPLLLQTNTQIAMRFVYAGALTEDKGVVDLLTAWVQGVPNSELWVAGKGEVDLEPWVANNNSIKYLGWLNEEQMQILFREAHVVVIPSRMAETYSLLVDEALAFGLPIIISEVAFQERLIRGLHALSFPTKDPNSLHEIMVDFARHRMNVTDMRRHCFELTSSHLWSDHLSQVTATYNQAREKWMHS